MSIQPYHGTFSTPRLVSVGASVGATGEGVANIGASVGWSTPDGADVTGPDEALGVDGTVGAVGITTVGAGGKNVGVETVGWPAAGLVDTTGI